MCLGGAHKNIVSVNKQVAKLLCKPLKRAANTIIPNSPSLKDRTALCLSWQMFLDLPKRLLTTFRQFSKTLVKIRIFQL